MSYQVVNRHGGNKCILLSKKVSVKRLHTVQLYAIHEKAHHGDSKRLSGCQGLEGKEGGKNWQSRDF